MIIKVINAIILKDDSLGNVDFSNSTATSVNELLQYVADTFFAKALDIFKNGILNSAYSFVKTNIVGDNADGTGIFGSVICVATQDTSSTAYAETSYSTEVDLTNYSKIKISSKMNDAVNGVGYFKVSKNVNLSSEVKTITVNTASYNNFELNISDLTGKYYIGMLIHSNVGWNQMACEYIILE